MSDQIVALIRTWTPMAVGTALAWLAVHLGIVVDEQTSTTVAMLAVTILSAAYYAVARWLERRWPAFGRLLGRAAAPVYPANPGVLAGWEKHR
jgi:hypothetical protein